MKKMLCVLLAALLACMSVPVFAEHVHTYDNGDTESQSDFDNPIYTPLDGETHNLSYDIYIYPICDECGQRGSVIGFDTDDFGPYPHNFVDGVCTDCGYQHVHVYDDDPWEEVQWDSPAYEIVDSETHMACYDVESCRACSTCGETVEPTVLKGAHQEGPYEHGYDEKGRCYDCGYQCKHGGTSYTYINNEEKAGTAVEIKGDDEYHTATVRVQKVTRCDICSGLLKEVLLDEAAGEKYWHEYNEDGVCRNCGHKCSHSKTSEYGGIEYDEDRQVKDIDDPSVHQVTGHKWAEKSCDICGKQLSYTSNSGVVTTTERHQWNWDDEKDAMGDRCELCGYINKCTHPDKKRDKNELAEQVKLEDTGSDDYHFVTVQVISWSYCPTCHQDFDYDRKYEDRKEPHEYTANGVCRVCGHVRANDPAQTPAAKTAAAVTAAEDATPMALVYVPVDADTPVNGVKAADALPMDQVVGAIAGSLEGGNVTITIPGIEKVLNAEEMARFDALGVQDRLMVALSALGFSDAFPQDEGAMSPEARALADDIAARLAALSPEALQALTALMAEFFPRETVTIDGVDYEGFSIDLVVDRDGEKTYSRYIFYNDGSQWLLHDIEVGEYRVAA